jgi:hypothetical protein
MFDYGNNADCSWQINPVGANSISLNFAEFDLGAGDALTVYDGGDANAPVLATLTGNSLPSQITSTDGLLFLQFTTDGSGTAPGWSLDYASSFMNFCTGTQVFTTAEGDLEDGSDVENYGNLSDCSWLIQPVNAMDITLTFTSFDTEDGTDFLTVFDGQDENAPVLGNFSGGAIPPSVMSTGGSMFIRFTSDNLVRRDGWAASYISSEITATHTSGSEPDWLIYPNPTTGDLTVQLPEWSGSSSTISFWNVYGQLVKSDLISGGKTQCMIDLQELHPGVYQIMWSSGDRQLTSMVLVK